MSPPEKAFKAPGDHPKAESYGWADAQERPDQDNNTTQASTDVQQSSTGTSPAAQPTTNTTTPAPQPTRLEQLIDLLGGEQNLPQKLPPQPEPERLSEREELIRANAVAVAYNHEVYQPMLDEAVPFDWSRVPGRKDQRKEDEGEKDQGKKNGGKEDREDKDQEEK
ncbi:hypothetical protein CLAFUW4_02277 [Fulvia fulva]|uniref:Uncharacterized protein n=1 Tax=Passalora fulva TaxID=5499 RepID=A0A9Q8P3R7_PASFU|nr:uncharacterized protein CLAFUR5_02267 [Fulvia fulva]KAK4635356.1 hypothetical protein CLAFUR4_02272 [Fulvia fulva]KAK4637774.1 hypothetical protein CLAFUR0_02276 [Fulvia fulva]UJO12208.1 hypothetical protein CLAFUR5_02267 [Fulvia fulva]WPV09273.1 hypothetical protein CLAFUW4_02277 [Fulvia fulva]WPV23104.1 hypothetical protein CLAFUW7_02277 [Fulvia fulva]